MYLHYLLSSLTAIIYWFWIPKFPIKDLISKMLSSSNVMPLRIGNLERLTKAKFNLIWFGSDIDQLISKSKNQESTEIMLALAWTKQNHIGPWLKNQCIYSAHSPDWEIFAAPDAMPQWLHHARWLAHMGPK